MKISKRRLDALMCAANRGIDEMEAELDNLPEDEIVEERKRVEAALEGYEWLIELDRKSKARKQRARMNRTAARKQARQAAEIEDRQQKKLAAIADAMKKLEKIVGSPEMIRMINEP
jgi:hypothetical protein